MSKAQQEFDNIIDWLRDHGGDVNHGAFLKACDKATILAFYELEFRVPYHILGQGYKTLDFAAALLRTHIPSDVMYSTLPGIFSYEFDFEEY